MWSFGDLYYYSKIRIYCKETYLHACSERVSYHFCDNEYLVLVTYNINSSM